jgi:hypothetical protein
LGTKQGKDDGSESESDDDDDDDDGDDTDGGNGDREKAGQLAGAGRSWRDTR